MLLALLASTGHPAPALVVLATVLAALTLLGAVITRRWPIPG